jgi:multidrug efflux pump subunit AcrB
MSVNGEFTSAEQMANIVVGSIKGGKVYLKDVADVVDTHKEQESFARLDEKNVVTPECGKRGGENLVDASDQINEIVSEFEKVFYPKV